MGERIAGLVGLLALAMAASAQAEVAAPPQNGAATAEKVIVRPVWDKLPDGEALTKFYPKRTSIQPRAGRAVIQCQVNKDGTLFDCVVLRETPASEDFGNAALKMAPYFQMKPMTADGTPVDGGTVTIPVVFNFGEDDFATPPGDDAGRAEAMPRGDTCMNASGAAGIEACKWVIQSGLWTSPRQAFAYERLGGLYQSVGNDEQAIAQLTKALSLEPRHASAFVSRGGIHEKLKRYDLAIADYSQAIAITPDFAWCYRARARAYHLKGDDVKALTDADKAVSLAPTNALMFVTRAEILEKLGRREDAIADDRTALKLVPDFSSASDGLKRMNASN